MHAASAVRELLIHCMKCVLLDFSDYTPPPANFDAAVTKPLVVSTSKRPSVKG